MAGLLYCTEDATTTMLHTGAIFYGHAAKHPIRSTIRGVAVSCSRALIALDAGNGESFPIEVGSIRRYCSIGQCTWSACYFYKMKWKSLLKASINSYLPYLWNIVTSHFVYFNDTIWVNIKNVNLYLFLQKKKTLTMLIQNTTYCCRIVYRPKSWSLYTQQ